MVENNTASNNAEVEGTIFNEFAVSIRGVAEMANEEGNIHNDAYLKCFGRALEHAMVGGETGVFDFPYSKAKRDVMMSSLVNDYPKREQVFSMAVALCDAAFPHVIEHWDSQQIECLRLVIILESVFRNKKLTNISCYFKDAQFSIGGSGDKQSSAAVPDEAC